MILGLLSLLLVLFKKYNWLYFTGIVSLLIQYNFVYAISKPPEELESEYLDYQFQPEFGFGLLTLGAVLVISSAITHTIGKCYQSLHHPIIIETIIEATRKILSSSKERAKISYQVTLVNSVTSPADNNPWNFFKTKSPSSHFTVLPSLPMRYPLLKILFLHKTHFPHWLPIQQNTNHHKIFPATARWEDAFLY